MTDLINILNRTGDGFCEFALAMLIQSGILIVLLYLVDLLIRKHVRAVFRYSIWMLVFVKLVLPPTLCLPTGIGYWCSPDIRPVNSHFSADTPAKVAVKEVNPIAAQFDPEHLPPAQNMLDQPVNTEVSTITNDSTHTPSLQPNELESASIATANPNIPITWQAVLFLTWLVGLLILSVLLIQKFLFVKSLLAQSDKADDRLNKTLQLCRRQVQVRRNIELRLSKNMLSPAACGLFKPVILIPASLLENLSKEKLRAVLIHELTHIKRGDLWVNFLQTILQIVYFYNPLLWFANAVVKGIREKAVDEMVLTKLGDDADSYSSTLIDIAEIAFSKPHFSLRLVGVVESKKALTSRIKHILSRPFPKTAKLGFSGFIAITITAAILLPMAKGDSSENINNIPTEYVGHWKGQANIIVNWTKQKILPIDIIIQSDGTVEGKVGDAKLVNGRFVNKSWVYTKVFQHKKPYRIDSDLQGNIIKSESIQRNSIMIGIKLEDGKIKGGLGTSGTKTGGKKRMMLSAMNVSLTRIDEDNANTTNDLNTNEFVAILPNGVTVELIGVCEHPSEGKQWWRPDGNLLKASPYLSINATTHGDLPREFAVRLTNLPDENISHRWNIAQSSGGAETSPLKDIHGKEIKDIWAIAKSFDKNANATTVEFGIASGPWQTQMVGKGSLSSGGEYSFAFSNPLVMENITYITVTDNMLDFPNRIIAVDNNEIIHKAVNTGTGSAGNFRQSTFGFQNLPLDTIKEFQFQTRPYEWVTFKNVSLHPLSSLHPELKINVQIAPGTPIPTKQEKKSTIDLAVVHEKIQALGLRDDTLEYHEQPLQWLKQHREKILPQLIEGLDSEEMRISFGCLKVLEGFTGSEDLLNTMIRISDDKEHPINTEAILSLCALAQDERVRKILEKALVDTERFSNPQVRATIAEALDNKAEAVKLLVQLLESQTEESELILLIKRLGDIGHKSAITALKKMSRDSRWSIAKDSFMAMAKVDPDKYGLTQDQETFLTDSRRVGKVSYFTHIAHWKKLAKLNKKEVRPFVVMQMIGSDNPEPALIVLQMWNDKEALPEIKRLMKKAKNWHCRAFIAAYLDIEGTDESITDVISLTAKDGPGGMMAEATRSRTMTGKVMPAQAQLFRGFNPEDTVLAVTQSIMTDKRKLTVLRRFRDELGHRLVANNLRRGGENTTEILSSLMTEETDISALGQYVMTAARDEEKRFDKEVHAALELLSSKDVLSSSDAHGAQFILDGCVAYKLADSGKLADKFLSPASAVYMRIAAAHVSATLGGNRSEALKVLYKELSNSNIVERKQVSECLVSIECLNNTERAEREEIILSHLGQPTEDYALRVLPTCAGKKTAEQLLPILDEKSVPRAVYTAWVLAQHPDKAVKQKALRRVAINAMFNHRGYQTGAGIDFAIAPDLSFHQNLNRWYGQPGPIHTMRASLAISPGSLRRYGQPGPAHIPDDLLVPFELDEYEQDFAIRAYRYSRLNIDVFPHYYLQSGRSGSLGASHLPLFRVITREDPHLDILYVKGKKVAHFINRKAAAKIIAGITNVKTSYINLAGEEIDSEQTLLQPYKNQNKLIARHILDQIMTVGIHKQPQDNIQYNRRDALSRMIWNLTNELGDDLKEELIAQSISRGIADELKNAGFSIWRKITE